MPSYGCATVRNTKIPMSFKDVGVCGQCKKAVALDGLLDSNVAICPECGTKFLVSDARLGFRKEIVGRKNQKLLGGLLTVTWLAATVAASFYGIPLPPPPITEDTFAPYKAPFMIRCRMAKIVEETNAYYSGNLYVPAKLPNPYESIRPPYSIEINDFDNDVNNSVVLEMKKLSSDALFFGKDVVYLSQERR